MRFSYMICAIMLGLLTLPPGIAAAKTFNAESFTLDNGLQVVVIPNHRAPVVAHMVWYKFGSADEKPGESGIAHFLEHLMFKGTPKVPNGGFSQTVRTLGGNDNAFTTADYTAYYQNISRDSLEKVMEMEADRMKNLTLTPEQVASERQVIIEERRQRIDNQPKARFQEQLMSALFVNHPYAIPVIGWLHEMKELTREEAFDYYRTWYAPNNAILIVSGDITAEELKPLAKKYYGAIPAQAVPPRRRPRPAPIVAEHQIVLRDKRVGQPMLMKSWRMPRGSEAMEMLADIMGGSSTARLYKDLVVDKKLATTASADYDPISFNDTTFTLYAMPAPNVPLSDMQAAMLSDIQKLLDKGVTLEELQSAKKRAQAQLTYYRDSLQGPAMIFGRALASGFTIDDVENRSARLEKLTIDDVNTAAKIVFGGSEPPVTGLLLPEAGMTTSIPATETAP